MGHYKLLDVFCGLGGWSKGFDQAGFSCTGIDIVNVGYPFRLILQDVINLDGNKLNGFDVIVGSPPCRDFSRITSVAKSRKWKIPPDPERGLILVNEFLRVVKEANPRYWLLENVIGLIKYLNIKQVMIINLTGMMKRAFWGNFPLFLIPQTETRRKNLQDIGGKKRAYMRAEIPFCCAYSLAKSINESLDERL